MKKSEIYHTLQLMTVRNVDLYAESKLEFLRELFVQEDLAKFQEELEGEDK